MPCLLDHPVVGVGDERLEDRRRDVGVVVRAEDVADVVEQGAHDVLVVLAGAVGARRRLQRVLEAVDGEAAGVALEQPQVGEHAVGQPGGERQVVVGDDAPVQRRALGHRVERGPLRVDVVDRHRTLRMLSVTAVRG